MVEYISVAGDELKLGRHVRLRVLARLKHAAPHHCLVPEPGKVPSDFYTLAVRTDRVCCTFRKPRCQGAIPTPMITSDTKITARSIVSHVCMSLAGTSALPQL